ncbi:MAG: hypothetical protein WB791_03845 [Waddliaceae bacterium]
MQRVPRIPIIRDLPLDSYEVDLSPYNKAPEKQMMTLAERVSWIAQQCLTFIRVSFSALGQGAHDTLNHSWSLFKCTVLGYSGSLENFGPPMSPYWAVVRVAIWVSELAATGINSTFDFLKEHYSPPVDTDYLQTFSEDTAKHIDFSHMQVSSVNFDTTGVPDDVSAATLLEMFKEINFTEPDDFAYVPESSRKDANTLYTPAQLEENLKLYTERVTNRIAFSATPTEAVELANFYQQIEDAIRLAIHKVNSDLATFEQENEESIRNSFKQVNEKGIPITDSAKKNAYISLLENRNRVVLDMALMAKAYCGARYMGDTMAAYHFACGDSERSHIKTLKDALFDLLAQERLDLANKQIAIHPVADPHRYSNYMQHLGGLLGIPGSKNISENYSVFFDQESHLHNFFRGYLSRDGSIKIPGYTVNHIIDCVQDKIKNSQSLREKLFDWLQDQVLLDQVNNWEKDKYSVREDQAADEIEVILEEPLQERENDLVYLQLAIDAADELPSIEDGWETFLDELFAKEEVKKQIAAQPQFAREKFGNDLQRLVAIRKKITNVKELAKNDSLAKTLQQQIEELAALALDELKEIMNDLEKVKKIQQRLPLQNDTALRIVHGELDVREAACNTLNRNRAQEFLEALSLEEIESDGISSELMEWLLVSQGILLPQTVDNQEVDAND